MIDFAKIRAATSTELVERDAENDARTLDQAIALLARGKKTLSDVARLSNVNPETRRLLLTVADAFGDFVLKHERKILKPTRE